MKNIATAFIAAKRQFGPALKDKTNPAFRSKYADLGACIDAVDDALLANGLAFYQETFDDPTGVTVETVFLHESGESMRCGRLHVPATKQDAQGYGSALTYCRRYSLMAACGIAPEDDDANSAVKTMKHRPTEGAIVKNGRITVVKATANAALARHEVSDFLGAYELVTSLTDSEEKTALWALLPSDLRAAIKKHSIELRADGAMA